MLVERYWRVKITDFNLSHMVQASNSRSLLANNPRWLAPEVSPQLLRSYQGSSSSVIQQMSEWTGAYWYICFRLIVLVMW